MPQSSSNALAESARSKGHAGNQIFPAIASLSDHTSFKIPVRRFIPAFSEQLVYGNVTDPTGRRHSLDVLAESSYDAAHLFVVEAKQERRSLCQPQRRQRCSKS
jgi:hypothetical protein